MTTKLAAFVVHWIVEDPQGPICSKKPPGADRLEKSLAQCPGLVPHPFGNPSKRFAVACRQVEQLNGLQHRGSADERIVNCPGCVGVIKSRREAQGAN